MQANSNLISIDAIMDSKFGKVGSAEREEFRREAYVYCMGQVIHDVRKTEKITQKELANRIGAEKSYISKIEKGIIEPRVSTFYRIDSALGRSVELAAI